MWWILKLDSKNKLILIKNGSLILNKNGSHIFIVAIVAVSADLDGTEGDAP